MTEDEIKNWMRTYAVEVLTVNLLVSTCLAVAPDDPKAVVERIRRQMIDGARSIGFPGVDPAMSDLASAELEDALDRLMEMADAQIDAVLEARKTNKG